MQSRNHMSLSASRGREKRARDGRSSDFSTSTARRPHTEFSPKQSNYMNNNNNNNNNDDSTHDHRSTSNYKGGTNKYTNLNAHHKTFSSAACAPSVEKGRDVVVILERAGLLLGRDGLVDAYDRAATTEIANASLRDVRPDIVHQCLLALFDSELGQTGRLRVYLSLFSRSGKTIAVSPVTRPPRTFRRFKGLMATVLRNGEVRSADGDVLMHVLPGSVAPIVPHGAPVIGITNALSAPVRTPTVLAREATARPVDDALQGGVKHVAGFFVISCTEECDLDGVDYVTEQVCLNAYPTTAHVMCARICEGFARVTAETNATH